MKTRNNVVKMGVVASAAALALCGAMRSANAGVITNVSLVPGSQGSLVGGNFSVDPGDTFPGTDGSNNLPGGDISLTVDFNQPAYSPQVSLFFAVDNSSDPTGTRSTTSEYQITFNPSCEL